MLLLKFQHLLFQKIGFFCNLNLPKNLIKSLYEKQRAFRFRFNFDPNMWRWGFQFIQQCTKSKMKENTLRKHRLSTYSQIKLHELINETGIETVIIEPLPILRKSICKGFSVTG